MFSFGYKALANIERGANRIGNWQQPVSVSHATSESFFSLTSRLVDTRHLCIFGLERRCRFLWKACIERKSAVKLVANIPIYAVSLKESV